MNRTTPLLTAAFFAAVLASSSVQAARMNMPLVTDLTAQFRNAGLPIDQLEAFEVGGIVVIRGQAADTSIAEQAGRVAQTLGYTRVANLVQVVTPPDDAAIARRAERELAQQRSLDGCKLQVGSTEGVLSVNGQVRHELQKDMVVQLLRNIDGVREVRTSLSLQ